MGAWRTIHTSLLFDPKTKSFLENVSIKINPQTGAIIGLRQRSTPNFFDYPDYIDDHIDLRGKVVLPGLVDSHTHIFLHSDKSVPLIPFQTTPI